MTDAASIKDTLHRLADEIRVRIHLAGMEAKDAWSRLEPRLREFEHKAEAATGKLGEEVTKWGHELEEQAKRIRDQLRKS
jgi:hypothetical protein